MRRSLSLLSALVLGSAAPLYAAEGGLLDINPGLSIWTVIIFGLVFLILWRLAFPKILGAVEAREAHLREMIEAAERDRAEAATLIADNRREMEEARAKIQAAMAEGRAEVERMKAEILAEARRDQEEMLQRARRDIASEREAALDAVRRDAVDLAIRAAEKLVRRNLDGEDNRRLVREYLGEVSETAIPVGV